MFSSKTSPAYRLAFLATLVSLVLAKKSQQLPCAANPYVDPKDDPCNAIGYITNNTLTAIAFSLYVLVAFFMTFATVRWGAKYMLSMTIGAYTMALGLAFRFGMHQHPDSKGMYIVEYLFVVLSPCAFIAADYVLLGRLSRYLKTGQYLLVRPERITKYFIASDVTTFLIQAAGGSLSISSNDAKGALTGSRIFLAGLCIQAASFFTFTCIFLRWARLVRKNEPAIWTRDAHLPWYRDWRTLARAQFFSCIGILIRSGYRVAELSQGFDGPLTINEGDFYGLDTLPLFLAIAIYVPFWPAHYIPRDALTRAQEPVPEAEESTPSPTESHTEKQKEDV
ncbi:RTA1-like protein [Sistotremastrum niveocremeum HHB9708]|uniref:RTA1-like protein n=1 Tax=Sistotremastrum niveocremeum HHB9708 TaxID=1314777 RepID=A0A164ZQU5_9AGAM|nr:RTA1-like protein [Sistotremastrum niveocremeum HHB9708]